MKGRLAGLREPHLRRAVADDRYRLVLANPGDEAILAAAVDAFRGSATRRAAS